MCVSLSTVWVLRIELRFVRLGGKYLYWLTLLVPSVFILAVAMTSYPVLARWVVRHL